ncbi:MAG: hypothetical protein R3B47_06150 [Bacteroidia bacterium]
MADLKGAGIFWLASSVPDGSRTADYEGKVHITRLHLRYDRENFPQDLLFQATPNRENFQARYVTHIPAKGSMDCDAAEEYLSKLALRREAELKSLNQLTGWDTEAFAGYINNATNGSTKFNPGDLSRVSLSNDSAVATAPSEEKDSTIPLALILGGSALLLGGGFFLYRTLKA